MRSGGCHGLAGARSRLYVSPLLGSIWCFPAAAAAASSFFYLSLSAILSDSSGSLLFLFHLIPSFPARSLCPSLFLSFSSSPYFLPLPFSLARSLVRFSRNNLISVVVRSFYFGVFSDPFRLVWQLMQPIFRLVSFYPAGLSLINMQILFAQRFSARKDRRLASFSARV